MGTEHNNLDPRITRTRQALRLALIELIQQKGYRNITVKDITQRAGLNRSTFYLHFQNKDDLLSSGFAQVWEKLVNSLPFVILPADTVPPHLTRAALAADLQGLEKIRPYYQVLLGRDGPPQFKLLLREQVLTHLREQLAGPLHPLPEERLACESLLHYLSGAYLGLLDWWMEKEAPCTPERMADLFIWLFSRRPYDMMEFNHPLENGQAGDQQQGD